jgi:hypothetical protein
MAWYIVKDREIFAYLLTYLLYFFPWLHSPALGLGLLHKIGMNFLEASQQFSFSTG